MSNEKTGLDLIAEKRAKHAEKGWTSGHDDGHLFGSLAKRAAELAVNGTDAGIDDPTDDARDPWGLIERHPDRIEQLAIAGSLIAAEIDRELRKAGGGQKAAWCTGCGADVTGQPFETHTCACRQDLPASEPEAQERAEMEEGMADDSGISFGEPMIPLGNHSKAMGKLQLERDQLLAECERLRVELAEVAQALGDSPLPLPERVRFLYDTLDERGRERDEARQERDTAHHEEQRLTSEVSVLNADLAKLREHMKGLVSQETLTAQWERNERLCRSLEEARREKQVLSSALNNRNGRVAALEAEIAGLRQFLPVPGVSKYSLCMDADGYFVADQDDQVVGYFAWDRSEVNDHQDWNRAQHERAKLFIAALEGIAPTSPEPSACGERSQEEEPTAEEIRESEARLHRIRDLIAGGCSIEHADVEWLLACYDAAISTQEHNSETLHRVAGMLRDERRARGCPPGPVAPISCGECERLRGWREGVTWTLEAVLNRATRAELEAERLKAKVVG